MVRSDRAADHLIPHLFREVRALPFSSLIIRISRGGRSSHSHRCLITFLLALGDLRGEFNRLTTFLLMVSGDMGWWTSRGGWGRGIFLLHYNGWWLGNSLLDPLLGLYLLECESVPGVDRQKALDDLDRLDREEGWYLVVALQNLLVQKGRLILLERQITANHRIEGDATRPDIHSVADVLFTLDHLRGRVARTPTRCRKQLAVRVNIRKAKIDYLYRLAFFV